MVLNYYVAFKVSLLDRELINEFVGDKPISEVIRNIVMQRVKQGSHIQDYLESINKQLFEIKAKLV
ncbi:MAG: hypothetical protein KKB65_01750 [Nanoarchaeota archaeon]|nr:hypothetical protein [Nanoarchaeota archaeon]